MEDFLITARQRCLRVRMGSVGKPNKVPAWIKRFKPLGEDAPINEREVLALREAEEESSKAPSPILDTSVVIDKEGSERT